jgi:hypothetical protein
MAEWVDREAGPECVCGWPTFVHLHEGQASLICFGHTKEEGASFPLPKVKPEKWPGLDHNEMAALVSQGMKEHGLSPGDDVPGPEEDSPETDAT